MPLIAFRFRRSRAPTPSPWRLGGLPVTELARRVWRELWADEIFDRAAALSYYFLFSLFPALLFLTSLLGLLPFSGLMDRLLAYLAPVMPGDSASMLTKTVSEIRRGARGGLLSVGAVAALWAASAGMMSIITALNVAYDVTDTRPWWRRRMIAMGLTIVFTLFTLTALTLLVFGPKLVTSLATVFGLGSLFTVAWKLLEWPVAALVVLTGIALVYYLAPNARQRWHWITPGSVVALLGWMLASAGLRVYVSYVADYNRTYGSIGGVILLVLWLFMDGVMLLTGAEINAVIDQAAAERRTPAADGAGERAPEAIGIGSGR